MLRRFGQLRFPKVIHPIRHYTTETEPVVQEVYRAKKRKFNFGTALLCTIPFVTFGLGTWQLQRLRWKVNLISTLEDRLQREPIPLPKRIK
jgi:surfeit locus 1 family protein